MKQSHVIIIINLNWDTLESCKTEQKNIKKSASRNSFILCPNFGIWVKCSNSTMYLCTRNISIYSNEFKFVYIFHFSVVKYVGRIEWENVNIVSSKIQYILHMTLYTNYKCVGTFVEERKLPGLLLIVILFFCFSLKMDCEKLVQEKTEMQRHYVMVMSFLLFAFFFKHRTVEFIPNLNSRFGI